MRAISGRIDVRANDLYLLNALLLEIGGDALAKEGKSPREVFSKTFLNQCVLNGPFAHTFRLAS
ncbi:MAG: hypothetical protein ABT10_13525 [Novosphingobium sp. SCN 63-17]|nr:MAG: hypothetical protein ABT10_13525 [Novosphingobium sp. SCN 63-17]